MARSKVGFTSLQTEFRQFVAKRRALQSEKQDPLEVLLIDPFYYWYFFGPQAESIVVTITQTEDSVGVRFAPNKHGGLASVCSSILKHTITPSEHRLSHVNDQPLDVFLPATDSASPNSRLSASIASLSTPFCLTFKRRLDVATIHPKALRIFLDGGARSRD
jgi:hypothetical protein